MKLPEVYALLLINYELLMNVFKLTIIIPAPLKAVLL